MKKQTITFLLILSSTLIMAQSLKVEQPDRLDYKRYWRHFNMSNRFELDFNNITKSNNEFWKKKADLRLNTGKYQRQHWQHLTKKIKKIEEFIYKNTTGEDINTYLFDSFGNIIEKIHSYNEGKFKEKEVYTYNENQNIVEYAKYRYSSDPDYWYTNSKYELDEKHVFKYNKNQQLVFKEGNKSEKIAYTYNAENLIIKIQYFGYNSGPNAGIIAYSTDISNEELEEYKNKLRNNLLIEYTFEYDSRGNRILEKKVDVKRNETLYIHKYEYNENNLLSKFIVDNYVFEYFYNDKKLLIKEVLTNKHTNKVLKSVNEYNNNGQLISNISVGEYGNNVYQTDFKYDENNNIIEVVKFKILNNKKVQYYTSQQKYDKNSNMIKCTSFGRYRWIEKYNYDELGRLLHYTRKSDNKTYDEYNYKYDENGGIIESDYWNNLTKRKFEYY